MTSRSGWKVTVMYQDQGGDFYTFKEPTEAEAFMWLVEKDIPFKRDDVIYTADPVVLEMDDDVFLANCRVSKRKVRNKEE